MAWDAKRKHARQKLDSRLLTLRPADRFQPPAKGWIRAIRDALGLSSAQLGRTLGVRSQSVDDMEKTEASGTIRLETLRRVAAALDCQMVYALVPNSSLDAIVQLRARAIALTALSRVDHTMALEDQSVDVENPDAEIDAYIEAYISERDLWS